MKKEKTQKSPNQLIEKMLDAGWQSHIKEVKRQVMEMLGGVRILPQHPAPLSYVEALEKNLTYAKQYLKEQQVSAEEQKSILEDVANHCVLEVLGQWSSVNWEVSPTVEKSRLVSLRSDRIEKATEALREEDKKLGTQAFAGLVAHHLQTRQQMGQESYPIEAFAQSVQMHQDKIVQQQKEKIKELKEVFEKMLKVLEPLVNKEKLLPALAEQENKLGATYPLLGKLYFSALSVDEQKEMLKVMGSSMESSRRWSSGGWIKTKNILKFLEDWVVTDDTLYIKPLQEGKNFFDYLEQGIGSIWEKGEDKKKSLEKSLRSLSNAKPLLRLLQTYAHIFEKVKRTGEINGLLLKAQGYAKLGSALENLEGMSERGEKKKRFPPGALDGGAAGVLEHWFLYFLTHEQQKVKQKNPQEEAFYEWFEENQSLFGDKQKLVKEIIASLVHPQYVVSAGKDNVRAGRLLKTVFKTMTPSEVGEFFEIKQVVESWGGSQSLFSVCVEKGILARVIPMDLKVKNLSEGLESALELLREHPEGKELFEANYALLFEKKRNHVAFDGWRAWGQVHQLEFAMPLVKNTKKSNRSVRL